MAIIYNDNNVGIRGAIQYRRALQAEWEVFTYLPADGEICVATDTGEIRVGNGKNVWKDLPNPCKKEDTGTNPFLNITGINCT